MTIASFFYGTESHWQQFNKSGKQAINGVTRLTTNNIKSFSASLQNIDAVLVYYSLPEAVLADLLDIYHIDEAIRQVQNHLSMLLDLKRNNRRHVVLVPIAPLDLEQALELPEEILLIFNEISQSNLLTLIGKSLLESTPEIAEMLNWLLVSSLPLAQVNQPNYTPFNEYKEIIQHQLRTEAMLNATIDESELKQHELIEESELLLLQLMQVQDELESYYIESKNLQNELSEQKAKYSTIELQLYQLEQAHSNTQRATIAKQNHSNILLKQIESKLSSAHAVIDKLQRQLAGATLSGQQAKTELKAVKSSMLWKVLAPVRKLTSNSKRKLLQLQKDIDLVRSSSFFDTDWYLKQNPDVAGLNKDPIEHYLRYGAKEGRVPGPDFDGNWYISNYPDVAQSGMNPLVHYIKFGQVEGRQTSNRLLQLKLQTNRIAE